MNANCKKIFLLMLAFVIVLFLSGCSDHAPASEDSKNNTKTVLCASFPEYDWTRNILGDNPGNLNLQLLNRTGADMHSYQPSVSDMTKISDADLLIYTGGISEFWVDDASISSMKQPDAVLSLMEYFEDHPDLFPSYVDEDSQEDGEAHDHEAVHEEKDEHAGHHHSHDHDADEHLWLSLKIAPVLCEKIADQLAELDSDNADVYRANAEHYMKKLLRLDSKYQTLIDGYKASKDPVLIFADRYPFTYMMQDYGITAFAAFPGCSAETEASFHTVIGLAEQLDSLHLSNVIVLKNSSNDLSGPIIQASGKKDIMVLTLDSIQSVTAEEFNSGYSYLQAMEENYTVLAKALSQS